MGRKGIIVAAVILVLVGIGGAIYAAFFYKPTPPVTSEDQAASDILTYQNNPEMFSVSKNEVKFGDLFTTQILKDRSLNCDMSKPAGYFEKITAKFSKNDKAMVFTFQYSNPSQGSDKWTVTVIPNKPNYSNIDKFKEDFRICEAGGDLQPIILSGNYLAFESSCGSGYDDGSGLPHGCYDIQEFLLHKIGLQ